MPLVPKPPRVCAGRIAGIGNGGIVVDVPLGYFAGIGIDGDVAGEIGREDAIAGFLLGALPADEVGDLWITPLSTVMSRAKALTFSPSVAYLMVAVLPSGTTMICTAAHAGLVDRSAANNKLSFFITLPSFLSFFSSARSETLRLILVFAWLLHLPKYLSPLFTTLIALEIVKVAARLAG